MSSWLANAPRQPLSKRDFALIKQAGFDFVRLPFNPAFFGFSIRPPAPNQPHWDFAVLDHAIDGLNAAGLAVILDLHPREDFKQELENNGATALQFADYWQSLATRYKNIPPAVLAYEILNEPQYYHHSDVYNHLMQTTVARIRAVDPTRLVIIGAPATMAHTPLSDLQKIVPQDDAHIIYDVHFYNPILFTHQGITSGFQDNPIHFVHNLAYPADAEPVNPASIDAGADQARAQHVIDDYRQQHWDKSALASQLDPITAWAQRHHTRVTVLEFGALSSISPAWRYAWIRDVRSILDSRHIGWALWDYGDLFGITHMQGETLTDPHDGSVRFAEPTKGLRQFDPAALQALGLMP